MVELEKDYEAAQHAAFQQRMAAYKAEASPELYAGERSVLQVYVETGALERGRRLERGAFVATALPTRRPRGQKSNWTAAGAGSSGAAVSRRVCHRSRSGSPTRTTCSPSWWTQGRQSDAVERQA